MKRQRNTTQMKEQTRNTEVQMNEEEIGQLPEKEFRIMIVSEVKWSEVKSLNCVRLFATPWTVAYWAPLSMGFSRQEHWSGLPFPSPAKTIEREKVKSLNCVRLLVTPWTAAHQALPSIGFSRQEYWSGVPLLLGIEKRWEKRWATEFFFFSF